MNDYSIQKLWDKCQGDTGAEIRLGILLAESYNDYLKNLNNALKYILEKFSRTPKERSRRSEDEITLDIIDNLESLGFHASHDTTVGGHVDIVVKEKFDFLWLGEAKIHSSYEWLLQGFDQLTNRYTTGNESNGGFIIYHKGARTDHVMEEWARRLEEKRSDVTILSKEKNEFISQHIHPRTGEPYKVRHLILSLYWPH